jgi:NAD(P)-dependent dehydrogenase (short-subunit alcohol dehydrogenase family)
MSDVNKPGGEETVRLIGDAGGEAVFAQADVSSQADCEALVWRTVETYSWLDIACNNAGIE